LYTCSRHPGLPVLPYTTLFRSLRSGAIGRYDRHQHLDAVPGGDAGGTPGHAKRVEPRITGVRGEHKPFLGELETAMRGLLVDARSEEHTSELQSRVELVCGLLL